MRCCSTRPEVSCRGGRKRTRSRSSSAASTASSSVSWRRFSRPISVLRHRFNWKRLSMAGALAYRPDGSGAALMFQIKEGSYNTESLIGFLHDLREHFAGANLTLIWDGLPAHRSNAMKDWITSQQDWLTVERDDLGQRQGRRAGQPVPRHHRQVHQGETFLLTFARGPLVVMPGGGRGAVCTVAFARASRPRAAVGEPARSRRSCRRGCSGCPRPGRAGRRCTGRARIHRACRGGASVARRNCRRGPRS